MCFSNLKKLRREKDQLQFEKNYKGIKLICYLQNLFELQLQFLQLLTRHSNQLYKRVYITAILNIFPAIRIVGRIVQMYTDLNEIIRLIIIKIILLVKIDNLNRPLGSSLENYMSNNTSQYNTAIQHDTSTTRHNTTRHEQNTRQHEYNTTLHEYKGSSGSKNRVLLHIFCYLTIYFLNFFQKWLLQFYMKYCFNSLNTKAYIYVLLRCYQKTV